jgi:hypothetical protein
MSKINNIISSQAFEVIRDRIGAILAIELDNQAILSYDPDLENLNIYIERKNPFDKTELSAINVCFIGGPYDNKNYGSSIRATYSYTIDCHTMANTNSEQDGDERSSIKCQKLLGKCRYILENPVYKTLDFNPPFVFRVYCTRIDIADQIFKQDAVATSMGRIIFNVEVTENADLINPDKIQSYYTQVKIDNSNDGLVYLGGN